MATNQQITPRTASLINLSNYLASTSKSFQQKSKQSLPLSLLFYILNSIKSFLQTLLYSPFTFFLNPITTLTNLIIYPLIFIGLWNLILFLSFSNLIGGGKLLNYLSEKYSNGFSIVNWSNSDMFEDELTLRMIVEAKKVLRGEPTTYTNIPVPNSLSNETHTLRIFSVEVSILLLLFSSIVYERNDTKVKEAVKLIQDSSDNNSSTLSPDEKIENLRKAQILLEESEDKIQAVAKKWNTRYEIVSDLATLSGPFASIFYNSEEENDNPWMVLVFKGTGLSNFAEFLVDASIKKISSKIFLGDGMAHQGFYSDLFATSTGSADGYGTVLKNIHRIAASIKKPNSPPIPLWTTGHSLGSALASLFYFRLLNSPQDLNSTLLILRDSYNVGTPRTGNGSFASQFTSLSLNPINKPNILWRIVNLNDLVNHLPPGLSDEEMNRNLLGMEDNGTLDYSHIGNLIQLKNLVGIDFKTLGQGNEFHTRTKIGISRIIFDRNQLEPVELGEKEEEEDTRKGTVLSRILKVLPIPSPLKNHFPGGYYERLILIQPNMVQSNNGEWRDI